jgi:hypothetical protein
MSDSDMSKLAKVAETFLKSQDQEASDQAYAELQRLTGHAEKEPAPEAGQAAPTMNEATPVPSIPVVAAAVADRGNVTPTEQPETAASRAAMLKERLLATKRGGYNPSTRDTPTKPAENDAPGSGSGSNG